MRIVKQYWLSILLILIIFFTRLLIFNKDAVQFWADESRYPTLIAGLDEAYKSGNYLLLTKQFFNIDARPGSNLFYFLPAFLEWKFPNIPFGLYFNLIISTLSLIVVFFILKKILNDNAAILATLFVTLSITSLLYIRHTLPYDIALFLLLIGLYSYVYFRKLFVFGLFCGLSFLTYPGYYYYLIPIPLLLIFYNKSLKAVFTFVIGIFLILIVTQAISVSFHTNYFNSINDQSGGVTAIHQGDYMPAAAYISEYILAADGYWDLLLILAILPSILLIKDKKKIVLFAVYLISVFLIFEVFSHILQRYVLYGRTVRPLYLLSLGFAMVILERLFSSLKNKKIYAISVSVLLLISILNWWPRFLVYKDLVYPVQFKREAADYLKLKYNKNEINDALFVNYWNTNNPDLNLVWHFFKHGESGKYYTMNAIQTYPYYGNFNVDQFCKNEVLIKKPHIQYIFKLARFEGYQKDMRDRMDNDPLYYQLIYCK